MNSNLTFINSYREGKRTRVNYKCNFCGKESSMRMDQFKIAVSCGCKKGKWNNFDKITPWKRLYKTYTRNAKTRNMEFNLEFSEFISICSSNCFYCNQTPSQLQSSSSKKDKVGANQVLYNGIDRLDNSKGYESNNVVSCCGVCNFMKRNLTCQEFINKALAISAQYKLRELGETPEVDNTEPSLNGDILEGVTTRGESQVDNNSSTSAGL